jgi:hypothetical protein
MEVVGGASTVSDAEAVGPLGPFVAVIAPVVLVYTAAAALVTLTVTVQVELMATVAPLSAMLPLPATAATDPKLQLVVAPVGVATTRPLGSVSLKATPVSEVGLVLGLPMVKVSVEVPLMAMLVGEKLVLKVGAPTTSVLSVAALLEVSMPPPPLTDTLLL